MIQLKKNQSENQNEEQDIEDNADIDNPDDQDLSDLERDIEKYGQDVKFHYLITETGEMGKKFTKGAESEAFTMAWELPEGGEGSIVRAPYSAAPTLHGQHRQHRVQRCAILYISDILTRCMTTYVRRLTAP